jgi:hypothetical protein
MTYQMDLKRLNKLSGFDRRHEKSVGLLAHSSFKLQDNEVIKCD